MTPITRVGLVAKRGLDPAADILGDLAGWLGARNVQPVFEADTAQLVGAAATAPVFSRDDLPKHCDLVVILGGDGTLIGMAGRIANAGTDVPILGVNFGSLGFLTEITLPELHDALEGALGGTAEIDSRMMLVARTTRGDHPFREHAVLNDIVLTKSAMSRIVEISVTVGDEPVTRVRADGLIVATPTGSTAYNLAAGGPIVHPAMDAIILTPIAPHTLSHRPVVISAAAEVYVRPIMGSSSELFVTFDGQTGFPVQSNDVVTIRRAPRPLRLIKAANRTYYEVLRNKLRWGDANM